jgi:hypothetical protein
MAGGCGGEDVDADGTDTADAPARASTTRPTGTLTLGDRTLEFHVSTCDLSDAEASSADEMLGGTGTLEDGTRFSLYLDRQPFGDREVHSVSLYSGAPRTGFFAEARNGIDATGEDEPIIRIDGLTVHATGMFDVDSANVESSVEGTLEATCPGS